jgi:hypothetical protein
MSRLASFILLASLAVQPALAGSGAHLVAQHGGWVTESRHKTLELVAQPDRLRVYVSDHGKPIAASRLSGRLTLLHGTATQTAVLVPRGEALEALGTFPVEPGIQVVAALKLDGKPLTARFVMK